VLSHLLCASSLYNLPVSAGVAEHQACRLDFEQGKIVLTKTNMFKQLWSHYMMTSKFQAVQDMPTIIDVFTDMLNSHIYIPSVALLSLSGRMTEIVAQIMWKVMLGIEISVEEARTLLFAPEFNKSNRYFNAAERNAAFTMTNTADELSVYDADGTESQLPPVKPMVSKVAAMSHEDNKVPCSSPTLHTHPLNEPFPCLLADRGRQGELRALFQLSRQHSPVPRPGRLLLRRRGRVGCHHVQRGHRAAIRPAARLRAPREVGHRHGARAVPRAPRAGGQHP